MTPQELRKKLKGADLSQSKAARLIGITDRSMRRHIASKTPIPRLIEYALRYVIEHGLHEQPSPHSSRTKGKGLSK